MITMTRCYPNKEMTEPVIDSIFKFMGDNKIDMGDYRLMRYFHNGFYYLCLELGCRIEYRYEEIKKIFPDPEKVI